MAQVLLVPQLTSQAFRDIMASTFAREEGWVLPTLGSPKKHLLSLLRTRDAVINKTQASFSSEGDRHLQVNISARLLLET